VMIVLITSTPSRPSRGEVIRPNQNLSDSRRNVLNAGRATAKWNDPFDRSTLSNPRAHDAYAYGSKIAAAGGQTLP
jgi:hypothetical protein